MIPFLELPRELRDCVYVECFIARRAISLQNLRSSPSRPVSQHLNLIPNLLASCRQIYEEGIAKLYGENLYFVDLTSSWRFSRSLQWCNCVGLLAEQFDICVACQQANPDRSAPDGEPALLAWNPNLSRVWRLQVSLQQYTYSQWKYRQPSAFPRVPHGCLHIVQGALPPLLNLRLLIVRILGRSLLSVGDSKRPSRWHAVSLRYNDRDIEQWKLEGHADLSRSVEDVLRYGKQTADSIVFSDSGRSPCVLTRATLSWTFLNDLLRTRRCFKKEGLDSAFHETSDRLNMYTSGGSRRLRERACAVARRSGSRLVSLDGEEIAFTSI